MKPAEERAFVLHQFVALRHAGLSALDAVNRLVEALPEGDTRRACADAARRLFAPATAAPADAFVRTLSDGSEDLARPTLLARALDAELELEAARRAGVALLAVAVAAPLVLLAVVGWMGTPQLLPDLQLPAPSRVVFALGGVLKWLGVPLAGAAALALTRWRGAPVLGSRSLRDARLCLEAAAAAQPEGALPALGLERTPKALVLALARTGSAREALEQVGARLLTEGRRRVETHRTVAALVLGAVLIGTLGGVITAAYLPIFSLAGSIQ